MPLETGSSISELVITNPAHTDGLNQVDSHLRLLKNTLKTTFPNISSPISLSSAQLNALVSSGYLAPDGTVSLPSHSFVAEPALGLYRPSAGRIGIVGKLVGNGSVPAGALVDFPVATAPLGYLACDGQSVLVADQPDLFAVIGYSYGGSGANFNIPTYKNRFRRHREILGPADVVGTLQGDQNKAHTHGFSGTTASGGYHAHTGYTENGGVDHTHPAPTASNLNKVGVVTGGNPSGGFWSDGPAFLGAGTGGASFYLHSHAFTTAPADPHSHTFSGTTASDGATEARPLSATVLTCIKT